MPAHLAVARRAPLLGERWGQPDWSDPATIRVTHSTPTRRARNITGLIAMERRFGVSYDNT